MEVGKYLLLAVAFNTVGTMAGWVPNYCSYALDHKKALNRMFGGHIGNNVPLEIGGKGPDHTYYYHVGYYCNGYWHGRQPPADWTSCYNRKLVFEQRQQSKRTGSKIVPHLKYGILVRCEGLALIAYSDLGHTQAPASPTSSAGTTCSATGGVPRATGIAGAWWDGDPFAPAEVQSAINDIMQAAGEREWPAGWFEQQADTGGAVAERELERILEIQTLAAECSSEKVSEATWNLEVHGPLLKLAMTAIRGVSRHLITTARIESKWLPITRFSPGPLISASESGSIRCSGNTVGGKMVDFALTLDTASTPLAVIKEHIYASDLSADLSINQTTYNPLTLRPIGVSVETKASAAGAEQGRIQLALWTIAWYKRVQAWVDSCADDIRLPDAMPVILVTEHAWNMAFVCNRGGEAFELILISDNGSSGCSEYEDRRAGLSRQWLREV
ncbi:hypothetical protein MGG_17644 [Pyricularia oryzae 70-15]|uniref:PD-(D/E)XK nuclease-like domain-containing protein n=1 Tax=Pyricularia oryzae (strain 70-15 / ATCC MYA-4617 / FGSC 8958) TaxID=242507 RepID=G4NGJ7_PYRO7|nr:uncharacterized protein MGG_17644 [Pyricularia oryzae 70-15]EHA47154.1 hypothetical protein MGG_17644 [Pyricularia oryzae 70-15]